MESIVAKLDAALYPAVCSVNTYLSNYILVFLLVAVGLWYSIKTGFVQIRCFGEGMRKVFGNLTLNGKKHDSGMSSFQALATAIAAQVGTGNIVGTSQAIALGGYGAVFWLWLAALLGMMIDDRRAQRIQIERDRAVVDLALVTADHVTRAFGERRNRHAVRIAQTTVDDNRRGLAILARAVVCQHLVVEREGPDLAVDHKRQCAAYGGGVFDNSQRVEVVQLVLGRQGAAVARIG